LEQTYAPEELAGKVKQFSGYFRAPESGQYRFRTSGSQKLLLLMDLSPFGTMVEVVADNEPTAEPTTEDPVDDSVEGRELQDIDLPVEDEESTIAEKAELEPLEGEMTSEIESESEPLFVPEPVFVRKEVEWTTMVRATWSSEWRFANNEVFSSEWVTLEAGEYYPLRFFHTGKEFDHFQVGFEFKQEEADEAWFEEVRSHFHAQREVQKLSVN
jgi:hypothetical protein